MSLNELEALSTKQLLARLKRLNQCEESLVLSDREAKDYEPSVAIEFKDSPEWIAEYKQLKEVLAKREHVLKGIELVRLRQQKAGKGKSSDRKISKRKRR